MSRKPESTWALVTGASSGIGYELCRIFAKKGHNLILVARSRDRLREVAGELAAWGVEAQVIAKDLARPEAAEELFQEVQQETPAGVDILVNNAGFASFGPFAESDLDRERQMMQLNMAALTELTHRFLKEMVARGQGRILNVSSTAAFQPGPLMAVYYASKAYVLSFSQALAEELRGTGVTATALCPGPTKTDFQERAGMEDSRLAKDALLMDAETVAQAGYEGLMKGKQIVIPGLSNKALAQAVRFVPRTLLPRVVRAVQARERET